MLSNFEGNRPSSEESGFISPELVRELESGTGTQVPVPDSSSLARSGDPTLEFKLLARFASKFESTATIGIVPPVESYFCRFLIIRLRA